MALVASACVGNPGPFTIRGQAGSTLELLDSGGQPIVTVDLGRAACNDGVDNDVDGQTDLSDGSCTAAGDDSERLSGSQTFTGASLPVNVASDGAMTYDAEDLVVSQRELCVMLNSQLNCLGMTIEGVGTGQSGTVTGSGVTLPLPIVMELDAVVGFTGLGANCRIGTIQASFFSDEYNTTTGATTMVADETEVPAAVDCGNDWNALINGALGLPSDGRGTLEATILNGSGQPIQVS